MMRSLFFVTAVLALAACAGDKKSVSAKYEAALFAADVVTFEPGDGAGYGQSKMPDVVLGPPRGGGDHQGSLDVVSLGIGGEITLELYEPAVDGEGVDFIVFENAFAFGQGDIYSEPGIVSVSVDGETWEAFPCDAESDALTGCAGVSPVFANADDNDIHPTDVKFAGGDGFDLADVGLTTARYVRIRDVGTGALSGMSSGFDLDAVATVHRAE